MVPLDALSIEEPWDMIGMSATGSDTLVADQLFVPDHRVRRFLDMAEANTPATEPLYRLPAGVFTLSLLGPMYGIARSVFRHTMDVVGSGKALATSTYTHLADSPSVQAALADAATLIDSAWSHMVRSAGLLRDAVRAGEQPDIVTRTRLRMDAGHASRCLRQAVQLLLTVSGASAFARSNLVQRHWRDPETSGRHPSINEGLSREMYGRALVGVPEQVSVLL